MKKHNIKEFRKARLNKVNKKKRNETNNLFTQTPNKRVIKYLYKQYNTSNKEELNNKTVTIHTAETNMHCLVNYLLFVCLFVCLLS